MTEKVETGPKWALPEGLELPPDELRVRVDIYDETIMLHQFGQNGNQARVVSALDIARAFAQELRLSSGLLPQGALWWGSGPEGPEVAMWRPPQVWKVALVVEAFQPPRRFILPMPGLVFVCSSGRQPKVYAAKRRPASPGYLLYHAPLFNLFSDGSTCAGTHRYPGKVEEIPESFFLSFFTREGHSQGRSKKHPHDLLRLWEELDGKGRYPLRDMVPLGTVEQVMGAK